MVRLRRAYDPSAREALHHRRDLAGKQPVTLLTATRDLEHSHARVLVDALR